MKDYDVIYNGMVIGNIQALDHEHALTTARLMYSTGSYGAVEVEECE